MPTKQRKTLNSLENACNYTTSIPLSPLTIIKDFKEYKKKTQNAGMGIIKARNFGIFIKKT